LNTFRVITAIYNARFLPTRKEMQSKEQMIHFHCSIEALPRKGTDIILFSKHLGENLKKRSHWSTSEYEL
jgi:hypothetical protein